MQQRDVPNLLDRAEAEHKKPSRLARPLTAMAGAAAVLVAAVLGFSLLQSPSVSAEMLAAAEDSLSGEQGKVVVTAELSDGDPDAPEAIAGTLDFRYSGDDYSFTGEMEDRSGDVAEDFNAELVSKDGEIFARPSEDEMWFPLSSEENAALTQLITDNIPSAGNFDGTALEQLILVTDDVSKTEDGDTATYKGTVDTEEVLDLPAKKLPAVLIPFALYRQGDEPLPETLQLEMVTVNDEVETVTVRVENFDVEGETISGYATTDYTQTGEAQTITAPDPSEVGDLELE